jgi:hypothetical protein
MTKLVRGVQIIDFGFLTELVAANTNPTRLSDHTQLNISILSVSLL